jgi:hypothetical protein
VYAAAHNRYSFLMRMDGGGTVHISQLESPALYDFYAAFCGVGCRGVARVFEDYNWRGCYGV